MYGWSSGFYTSWLRMTLQKQGILKKSVIVLSRSLYLFLSFIYVCACVWWYALDWTSEQLLFILLQNDVGDYPLKCKAPTQLSHENKTVKSQNVYRDKGECTGKREQEERI